MYKEVPNFWGRLIGMLVFIISVILVDIPAIILLNIVILLFLSYLYKQKLIVSILIFILGLYNIFNTNYFFYLKTLVCFYYLTLGVKIMLIEDYIYIYEKIFYSLKKPKLLNKLIKKIHYNHLLNNNKLKYFNINKLEKKKKRYLNQLIITQTKNDLADIKLTYYLRFYNRQSKRTNFFKRTWSVNDNSFILIHFAIFIIAIIYRG